MRFLEKYLETAENDYRIFMCIALIFVLSQYAVILFGKKDEIDKMKPGLTGETVMKVVAAVYMLCTFAGTPRIVIGALAVMASLVPGYLWRIGRDRKRALYVAAVERRYGSPRTAVERARKHRALRKANRFFA